MTGGWPSVYAMHTGGDFAGTRRDQCLPANPTILPYDGFQSPAADPASGRVSPESHDAIATISAWS